MKQLHETTEGTCTINNFEITFRLVNFVKGLGSLVQHEMLEKQKQKFSLSPFVFNPVLYSHGSWTINNIKV